MARWHLTVRLKMAVVEIPEAEMRLGELITRAEAGEVIIITRDGVPVARLTALAQLMHRPKFGSMKDKLPHIPHEFFFDPLPEEELGAWEGGDDKDSL
jgi:prevent-host-death family protein